MNERTDSRVEFKEMDGVGAGSHEAGGVKRIHKVIIVAPTCFYYQDPMFKELAACPRIDLKVCFCSEEASRGDDVLKKFGTDTSWGVEEDLLQGYNYEFMRNYSPWPSYLHPVIGLMNFGVWREITKNRPDVVVLMSWMNPTWWLAILACLVTRTPFLYLTDQNVQRDLAAPWWKRWIKRMILGRVLFRLTTGFLCAGTANRLLYRYYGVPEHKLVPFAFSWGYDKLLEIAESLKPRKKELRAEFGIDDDSYVVLYCGRLSPEKGPMYILEAFRKVNLARKMLLIVGDGRLRKMMTDYVAEHEMDSVQFFGFRNRKEIPNFFAVSDLLVLPSDQETWGIVVNEAMCFGLPVVVSDQVGAARDLVRSGVNGLIFPRGDVDTLAEHINQLGTLTNDERLAMEFAARELIRKWSTRDLTRSLDRYFDLIKSDGREEPAEEPSPR